MTQEELIALQIDTLKNDVLANCASIRREARLFVYRMGDKILIFRAPTRAIANDLARSAGADHTRTDAQLDPLEIDPYGEPGLVADITG